MLYATGWPNLDEAVAAELDRDAVAVAGAIESPRYAGDAVLTGGGPAARPLRNRSLRPLRNASSDADY